MGYRQSFVFMREVQYGQGHDPDYMAGAWYVPPPGSEFNCTYSRQEQIYTECGKRVWSKVGYGKISGSWTWKFPLDYNYLEPFLFVYDSYSFEETASGMGHHVFKHTEEGVTPSFCVRIKSLYHIVGGPGDEVMELVGCQCTGIRMSCAAGDSRVQVTLQGIFADASPDVGGEELTVLEKTDYTDLTDSRRMVEFMCMKLASTDQYGQETETVLGAIESMSIQTTNSVTQTYAVLNPKSRARWEGDMTHQVSVAVFGVNPKILRHRVFSGGVRSEARSRYDRVMPLPEVHMTATTGYTRQINVGGNIVDEQVPGSTVKIIVKDVIIKMMQFMDSESRMRDVIDSAKCIDVSMDVLNEVPCKYDVYRIGEYTNTSDSHYAAHPICVVDTLGLTDEINPLIKDGKVMTHLIKSELEG